MSSEQATPLRIYRRVFAGFLEVASPPGKGEKVAGGGMRGLFAVSYFIKYLTALRNRAASERCLAMAAGVPRETAIDDQNSPIGLPSFIAPTRKYVSRSMFSLMNRTEPSAIVN